MVNNGEAIFQVRNLNKNFGVTQALSNVSFDIISGRICGLIGENGSGKSTVSSVIAGIQSATSGEMFYKGEPWKPGSVLEASQAGIAMIVQEAGTIPSISVAENIFVGKYKRFMKGPIVDKTAMFIEAQKALDKIGVTNIDPSLPTRLYDMQERKLIEIARAMYEDPEILIIDETTTALSQTGRNILYNVMHKHSDEGKAVVIISHDLDEVMEHCDSLTILRDAEIIDVLERKDFDPDVIKFKMIGREMKGSYYRDDNDGYSEEVVLKAERITTMKHLLAFSLELHKGEILGIGGLSDCGMHTLGRALYGLEDVVRGSVSLPGKNNVSITKPKVAFDNGLGYVSKDRDTESLDLGASIFANIASTGYKINSNGPFISAKKEKNYVLNQIKTLAIKCRDAYQPVRAMSGGNKQKVVFGKWCAEDADILILDCPTRGVDIGVKAAMYQLIYDMKKAGKSIVMISEELQELCGMSDRLLIIKDGKISGEFLRPDGFDNTKLINCMI